MHRLVDNRYRIVELLGSGGMAEVYLTHDETLDREIAIKILDHRYAGGPEFVERFKREARSAASLSHPNIVTIHDWGKTEDGTYYIAMEYVPGGTLKERILQGGILPPHVAVGVTIQVAMALEAAHRRGIVHRDVKPQNILVTEAGDVKVTDFGIAHAASSTTLTHAGSILGTARYISPEQAMGEPVGPSSDFYSLGVVLYEMVTGIPPYDADTPMALAMKHVNGFLRPPIEVDPDVPKAVDALTVKLLAKDPKERPQNAATLIEDLKRVAKGLAPKEATTRTLNQTRVWDRGAEICNRCGSITQAGDMFCGVCGARISAGPRYAVPTPHIPAQRYPSQGIPASRYRRKSLWWVIAVSVLLVLLAGAGAVAYTTLGRGVDLLGGLGSQPSDTEVSPPTPEGSEYNRSPSINPKPSEKRSPESPSGASSVSPDTPSKAKANSGADDTETEAEEAAGDYYRAVGLEDWDYTYENLDSQTKRKFTEEEWRRKNQWFADNNSVIYHILSVELDSTSSEPLAEVAVRLTSEDGSTSIRNTYFVFEGGSWKHHFSEEELELFMPGIPFEEFVEAR